MADATPLIHAPLMLRAYAVSPLMRLFQRHYAAELLPLPAMSFCFHAMPPRVSPCHYAASTDATPLTPPKVSHTIVFSIAAATARYADRHTYDIRHAGMMPPPLRHLEPRDDSRDAGLRRLPPSHRDRCH